MRSLSIRARITIGSAAAALLVIVVAVILIRVSAGGVLHSSDVSLARNDLASFEKDLQVNRGEHVDTPGAGVLVLVRSPDGATAVSTLPHDVRAAVEKRAPSRSVFSSAEDSAPYVVVADTVTTPDGTWGLWAARSTGSSSLVLMRLDGALVVGGLIALAAFTAASWLLATFALRPVAAMRRRAAGLSGSADDERLPVGAARDELSDLASTLNDFLERVQQANLREQRMVSDAAHELRTPLAALRTQLELAHDEFGDADALAREIIEAESSVLRLTGLATGLLELSRIEGHQIDARPTRVSALIDEAMGSVDRARMVALRRGVEVQFAVEVNDDTRRCAIEPNDFARVLDNLLANSLVAVDDGGSVDLSIRDIEGTLEVIVRDDGSGIPETFLPVAFDRFSRPDHGRSASSGGSGLGLALVRAIVESAGGRVRLENGAPGAIATVLLPQM